MKKLFWTFFVLTLFVNIQAQNYSKKDAIISASMIGTTFVTVHIMGRNVSEQTRAKTAFSGMAISAGYSLVKSTRLMQKIEHRLKMNRNRKINFKDNLICEK